MPQAKTGERGGPSARSAALALLNGVLIDGVSIADQMQRRNGPFQDVPAGDRARAQRLALGTLRALRTCDQMLGPYLRLPPYPHVHNILRLGTYELCDMGEAAHGVVSEAVDLARAADPQSKAPGLVNAILRKVAATGPEAWQTAPPASLPKPFRKPLVKVWGSKVVNAMETAHAGPVPTDLTLKDPATAEVWAERLGAQILPTGSLRLQDAGQVSALPGYEDGAWWVQDAAAALPARALYAKPGERVLDMCAAPGGKTLQLAAAGAAVTALDISAARMKRVEENLARTGLPSTCVVADAMTFEPDEAFDAILLDAPCSATGTIRRHPDLPYLRDLTDLSEVTSLQAALLARASGLLRPGGRLIYATCSLMPEEGEALCENVSAIAPDLTPVALDPLPGVSDDWQTPEGTLRIRPDYWPDLGGLDGFFIAAFVKQGATSI